LSTENFAALLRCALVLSDFNTLGGNHSSGLTALFIGWIVFQ